MTTYSKSTASLLEILDAPEIVVPKVYVEISFLRPDGDGIFRSIYNMAAKLDLDIVNQNIADGYSIVAMFYRGDTYPKNYDPNVPTGNG